MPFVDASDLEMFLLLQYLQFGNYSNSKSNNNSNNNNNNNSSSSNHNIDYDNSINNNNNNNNNSDSNDKDIHYSMDANATDMLVSTLHDTSYNIFIFLLVSFALFIYVPQFFCILHFYFPII